MRIKKYRQYSIFILYLQYKYSKINTNFLELITIKNYIMEDYNKPIWQLTIGEFVEILDSRKPESQEKSTQKKTLGEK